MAETIDRSVRQQSDDGATALRRHKLLAALRQIPFTLALLGVILLCAVLTNLFGAIDLANLDFKGRAWQDVRTALNKAEREGIRYEAYDGGAVPTAIQAQLRTISAAWTAEKELPEMGFTLGTLDEVPDPHLRTAVAIDAQDIVQGFSTWLPIYQGDAVIGWTIDLMRRPAEGFRNVMEFLIARSASAMRAEGYQRISLSSAPLARIAREGQETGPLQQLLELLAERLEPFYGFDSLFAFKQQFRPRWEPVYLIFPSVGILPQISVAIVRAYLPDLGLHEIAALLGDAAESGARGLRECLRSEAHHLTTES